MSGGLTANETVKINDLTLCHKHSAIGYVRSTLPDVCRSPVAPVPYTNTAYARDLENGTTTVLSHGGAMNGVKGSRFFPSYDDEPGTGGGVKSGVNMHEATWLSWSPNVFMEGRAVTRLTDKMLMNKGNTVSIGGYDTDRPTGGKEKYVCDVACKCYAKNRPRTKVEIAVNAMVNYVYPEDTKKSGRYSNCVKQEVSKDYYGKEGSADAYRSEHMYPSPSGALNNSGNVVRRYMDMEHLNKGNVTQMWDLKFPGDRPNGLVKEQDYQLLAAIHTGSPSNYQMFKVLERCDGCKREVQDQDFIEEYDRKRYWDGVRDGIKKGPRILPPLPGGGMRPGGRPVPSAP